MDDVVHERKDILVCESCGTFTYKQQCPACGKATANPKPARYSPVDAYGKYRRLAKHSDVQR